MRLGRLCCWLLCVGSQKAKEWCMRDAGRIKNREEGKKTLEQSPIWWWRTIVKCAWGSLSKTETDLKCCLYVVCCSRALLLLPRVQLQPNKWKTRKCIKSPERASERGRPSEGENKKLNIIEPERSNLANFRAKAIEKENELSPVKQNISLARA